MAVTNKQEFFLTEDTLKYNTSTTLYTPADPEVIREKNCNGFTVTNIGDTNIRVNGKILFASATPLTSQGDSFSVGGNRGEIYVGKIKLEFITPIGLTPLVEIVQKFYTEM
jgi:hypothetical protein